MLRSLLVLLFLVGCAPNISPDSYGVGSVGNVNRAVKGTVVSARSVDITGAKSGAGALAGASAGGVAGSYVGGDTRTNVLGAIGGVVVGAAAGAVAEEAATKQTGMEYVVETSNGALLTIVQGNEVVFPKGQKVIVLYGSRSRVIADTTDK